VASAAPPIAELVDRSVLDLALLNLPATIDLGGESWTPIEVLLPLE
jgi:hypothetical protein